MGEMEQKLGDRSNSVSQDPSLPNLFSKRECVRGGRRAEDEMWCS